MGAAAFVLPHPVGPFVTVTMWELGWTDGRTDGRMDSQR